MSPKLKATLSSLKEVTLAIELFRDEKQEEFDDLSEDAQESERGDKVSKSIDDLCEAVEHIYEATEILKGLEP